MEAGAPCGARSPPMSPTMENRLPNERALRLKFPYTPCRPYMPTLGWFWGTLECMGLALFWGELCHDATIAIHKCLPPIASKQQKFKHPALMVMISVKRSCCGIAWSHKPRETKFTETLHVWYIYRSVGVVVPGGSMPGHIFQSHGVSGSFPASNPKGGEPGRPVERVHGLKDSVRRRV